MRENKTCIHQIEMLLYPEQKLRHEACTITKNDLVISLTCVVLCMEMQVTQLVDVTDVHVLLVDL